MVCNMLFLMEWNLYCLFVVRVDLNWFGTLQKNNPLFFHFNQFIFPEPAALTEF